MADLLDAEQARQPLLCPTDRWADMIRTVVRYKTTMDGHPDIH